MKRLLALMGFFPLVWMEISTMSVLSIADHKNSEWVPLGYALTFRLLPDGKTNFQCVTWREWEHNKKHVVFTSTLQ